MRVVRSGLILLILCPVGIPGSLDAGPPDAVSVLADRRSDFLEIQGTSFSTMQGTHLGGLELLAITDGILRPIPFQVDERVEAGNNRYEWVLPLGPKGGSYKDDERLDADDELVFMAKDLGPRAGPAMLRQIPSPAVEIEVTDPVSKGKGFAYLAAVESTPLRTEEDYVRYDAGKDYIDTPVYSVGHSKIFPIAHNENIVKKKAGGEGIDLIDIFKQRILAKAFFGSLRFDKQARDWTSEISAYKDGPIRVIRKNENHLYIASKIKSPSLFTHTFYLRDLFWFPAEVNVPFKLSTVITSLQIFAATEFCRNAVGMRFFSNSVPQGLLVDGVLSPEEQALDAVDVNQEWQLVTGSQGTWMNRIVIGPGLEKVHRSLYYVDNSAQPDPPEEEPGIVGKIGVALSNLENLKGGRYTFRSYIHFPEFFVQGDEKKILAMLDHPLTVTIRDLHKDLSAPRND